MLKSIGGGGGAVDSVNGETGVVVLDAADVGAAGTSTNTFTGNQQIDSAEPRYLFNETDQGVNLKLWDLDLAAGVFTLRTRTDADGAGVNALAITRGATTAIASIAFGNATNNPGFSFLGSAAVTATRFTASGASGGSAAGLVVSSADASIGWSDSNQGTDLKNFDFNNNAGVFALRTVNDANSAARTHLSFTRGATIAVSAIAFGNATDNPSFTFLGTGVPGHGATTLLRTTVALTNGAAAQAGTLLNAPTAGNPTKWVPIDDNGTTRYIPAW